MGFMETPNLILWQHQKALHSCFSLNVPTDQNRTCHYNTLYFTGKKSQLEKHYCFLIMHIRHSLSPSQTPLSVCEVRWAYVTTSTKESRHTQQSKINVVWDGTSKETFAAFDVFPEIVTPAEKRTANLCQPCCTSREVRSPPPISTHWPSSFLTSAQFLLTGPPAKRTQLSRAWRCNPSPMWHEFKLKPLAFPRSFLFCRHKTTF